MPAAGERGVPPQPQSFTLPSHLPGQKGGGPSLLVCMTGVSQLVLPFPLGFLLGVEGKGSPPPPFRHGAPQGCSPTQPLLTPGRGVPSAPSLTTAGCSPLTLSILNSTGTAGLPVWPQLAPSSPLPTPGTPCPIASPQP